MAAGQPKKPAGSPIKADARRAITSYTCLLTSDQAAALRARLESTGWEFAERPHTVFAAKKEGTQVAVYEKGPKLLVQGKGTEDFVRFILEPEILGEARLGYEEVLNPKLFEPHAGVDESGKGDFFGPLVIAAAHVEPASARRLIDLGVMDSKRITSDARIRELARAIRTTLGDATSLVSIGPAKYNELHARFGNLNRLLAWAHARAIESLLEKVPSCTRALSDQFANPALLRRALMKRGRQIELISRTKAESDVAVAAASILARERFIDWLQEAAARLGRPLPKGAGSPVVQAAREIAETRGGEFLREVAKVHFRTAHEAAPAFYPAPTPKVPPERI